MNRKNIIHASLLGCALALHAMLSGCVPTVTEAQRQVILRKLDSYPPETANDIRSRRVRQGMTKEQVLLSWGQPRNISTYIGAHERETWQYGGCSGKRYVSSSINLLSFTDGVLASMYESIC